MDVPTQWNRVHPAPARGEDLVSVVRLGRSVRIRALLLRTPEPTKVLDDGHGILDILRVPVVGVGGEPVAVAAARDVEECDPAGDERSCGDVGDDSLAFESRARPPSRATYSRPQRSTRCFASTWKSELLRVRPCTQSTGRRPVGAAGANRVRATRCVPTESSHVTNSRVAPAGTVPVYLTGARGAGPGASDAAESAGGAAAAAIEGTRVK